MELIIRGINFCEFVIFKEFHGINSAKINPINVVYNYGKVYCQWTTTKFRDGVINKISLAMEF